MKNQPLDSTSQHSLLMLLGATLLLGLAFVYMVWPLLLPVIFAAAIAQLTYPLHRFLAHRIWGGKAFAAVLMTLLVLFVVIAPITMVVTFAARELNDVSQELANTDWEKQPVVDELVGWMRWAGVINHADAASAVREGIQRVLSESGSEIYQRTWKIAAGAGQVLIGLAVMTLALFFFYTDGLRFLVHLDSISLLDRHVDHALFVQFDRVCRGLIRGTLLAALAQAVLAGIGFFVFGVPAVWLLVCLTFFTSMIPFLGSASIWIPAALYLLWQGELARGVGLAIYGGLCVSTVDNLIRAYVIGGRARLHPLIALISVLGGIRVLGLWGVFMGPIVAAFLHALMKILRKRLRLRALEKQLPPSPADGRLS